jgi:hypothetical protein
MALSKPQLNRLAMICCPSSYWRFIIIFLVVILLLRMFDLYWIEMKVFYLVVELEDEEEGIKVVVELLGAGAGADL